MNGLALSEEVGMGLSDSLFWSEPLGCTAIFSRFIENFDSLDFVDRPVINPRNIQNKTVTKQSGLSHVSELNERRLVDTARIVM